MYYDLVADPIKLSAWRQRAHFEASRQGDAEILQIAEIRLLYKLASNSTVVAGRVRASGADLHGVGPDTQHYRIAWAKRAAFIRAEVELAAADDTGRHEVSRQAVRPPNKRGDKV